MKASHTTIKAVLGTVTTASLTTAYALTIYDKRGLTEDEIKVSSFPHSPHDSKMISLPFSPKHNSSRNLEGCSKF